jgi:excisionase family DNA binding protein
MSTNEHLLSLYLELAPDAREAAFADTAKAARLVGVSQRTIQLWIQEKQVSALRIGRKYQVDLESLKRYLNNGAG